MRNSAIKCAVVSLEPPADIEALYPRLMISSAKEMRKNKRKNVNGCRSNYSFVFHYFAMENPTICFIPLGSNCNYTLTCPKFDCFAGSLMVGTCELNCLLRVTDLANLANFDRPVTEYKDFYCEFRLEF